MVHVNRDENVEETLREVKAKSKDRNRRGVRLHTTFRSFYWKTSFTPVNNYLIPLQPNQLLIVTTIISTLLTPMISLNTISWLLLNTSASILIAIRGFSNCEFVTLFDQIVFLYRRKISEISEKYERIIIDLPGF